MATDEPPEGTQLIDHPSICRDQASQDAFQQLFMQVYAQLRAIAQQQIGQERPSHTLHATELVHQAFLRLQNNPSVQYSNQGHLVHAVAEAMRRILIEHARHRWRQKRGGDRQRVSLSLVDVALPDDCDQLLALDEALRRLEEQDIGAAEVVRLRFFAGLTIEAAAEAMELSPRTIKREWEWARAWLAHELE